MTTTVPLFSMPALVFEGEEPDPKTDDGFDVSFFEYRELQVNLLTFAATDEARKEADRIHQMTREAITAACIKHQIAQRHRRF